MFEPSFVEMPREVRRRKRWMTLASFTAESLAVVALLAVPLLRTEALPIDDHPTMHPPTRFVPPHVEIIAASHTDHPVRAQNVMINPYLQPQFIPRHTDYRPDPIGTTSYPEPACVGCISVSDATGTSRDAVMESVLRGGPSLPAHRAPVAPIIRSSHAQQTLLLYQVKPQYPHIAIITRTQGTVLLHAMISREGRIESLQVVSGPPLLVNAAVDAVRQWRYRPFLLNGEPVPVETQVTVNFTLGAQ